MKRAWFEDWFDTKWYHELYRKRDYMEAERFIDVLIDYLSPGASARFLDLACGKGRHSFYLAEKGFDVTGVDLSEQSILAAKARAGHQVEFAVHDMRQLYRAGAFDFVLNLFTSFGYFEQDDDHVQVLKNMRKSLQPNQPKARVIIDFLNAKKVIKELIPNELVEIGETRYEIKRSLESGFVKKEITVHHPEGIHQFYERVRLFELADFELLFEKAGLQMVDTFGDYLLNPYDLEADRLILIGAG